MGRKSGYVCPLVAGLLLAGSAQGALLNLTKLYPDTFTSLATIKYTASNSTLTVTASPQSFDLDGIVPIDYPTIGTPKSLSLSMTVNPATGISTGGTLSMTGKIPALGANSGTLLTGTIGSTANDFGFPTGGGTLFEWRFTVTGGDLASYYGGVGTSGAGIILDGKFVDSGSIPFTGVFTSNFQNASGTSLNGVADTFVPEPATLAALGGAAIGTLRSRRARRTHR